MTPEERAKEFRWLSYLRRRQRLMRRVGSPGMAEAYGSQIRDVIGLLRRTRS